MLLELGRKAEAIASVRSALALDPDLPEAHFNLHSLLIDSHELQPSIACLRRYVALRPADTDAKIHLAVLLDYAGDSQAAADVLAGLPRLAPASQALAQSWEYIKSRTAQRLPSMIGITNDAFRLGLQKATLQGLVLEFVVRFGVSIRQIAELAGQDVHGFDSFEGLPEAWHDEARGTYSTLGAMPAVPPNVTLHKGSSSSGASGLSSSDQEVCHPWPTATLGALLKLRP